MTPRARSKRSSHARRTPHVPALPLLIASFAIVFFTRLFFARATRPELAPSSLVVVTASNWMYRAFLRNFKCNLDTLNLTYAPVVYSLDVRTHNLSLHLGWSSVLLSQQTGDEVKPGQFSRQGPRSFNEITKNKLKAVLSALLSGLDVLLSDADIFWCSDPAHYLQQILSRWPHYRNADVLIQPEANYRTLNSGFYLVRSNERTVALFRALMQNIHIGHHDQDVVNKIFCDPEYGGIKIMESYGEVPYRCQSRGADIRVLPASKFPSGAQHYSGVNVFQYSRQQLRKMCDRGDFVVLHNNFIKAKKKKARLIVKGMWFASGSDEDLVCLQQPIEADAVSLRTCGSYC